MADALINAFLKIDGVEGEAKADGMSGYMDLIGWGYGMQNAGTGSMGGGSGGGKVQVNDFHFQKQVDKATPHLWKKCGTGEPHNNVELVLKKPGDPNSPQEYIKIVFDKAIISSMSTGGYDADGVLLESGTINFKKYVMTYKEQNDDGSVGGAVTAGYDVSLQKAET